LESLLHIIGTRRLTVRKHNMEIVEQLAQRIQLWIDERAKQLSPSTLGLQLSTFSRMFKFCVRRGYLFYNPIRFTTRPRIRRRSPPVFTFEEYEEIKKATVGTAYYWFTICSYRTGMAMIDVCLLKWASVDMDNLVISIHRHKLMHTGADATTIPFLPGSDIHICLQEFRDHPTDHWPGPEYVFPELASMYLGNRTSFTCTYTRILRRLGITGKSAMHWRHTFLSAVANSNTATTIACKMSGHANPQTLMRHIRPDVEAMRASIVRANEFMEKEKVKIYGKEKIDNGLQPEGGTNGPNHGGSGPDRAVAKADRGSV